MGYNKKKQFRKMSCPTASWLAYPAQLPLLASNCCRLTEIKEYYTILGANYTLHKHKDYCVSDSDYSITQTLSCPEQTYDMSVDKMHKLILLVMAMVQL